MKRVRVHNDMELIMATRLYKKFKPDSILKIPVLSFDANIYQKGVSVGYDEANGMEIQLFWSKPDDLSGIDLLRRQRTE